MSMLNSKDKRGQFLRNQYSILFISNKLYAIHLGSSLDQASKEGARELQVSLKSSDLHEIFATSHAVLRQIDSKFCISCQMKEFFLSHTTCRKYFLVTGRNFLALQVINCHRKKFIVTERNLLSMAEISSHKKKILVAGRNFVSQEGISCLRKKFLVIGRNFLS